MLSEFEVELGFGGNFLFAASVDLSTGASGSAYKGSDGRSLTSPKQSTQDGSDCGPASNVFRRALVGSQSTRRGFSLSTGDRIATAIDGDGAQVQRCVIAVLDSDQAGWTTVWDHDCTRIVLDVLAHDSGVGAPRSRLRRSSAVVANFDLCAFSNHAVTMAERRNREQPT